MDGKKVPLELLTQTSTMAVYKPKDELTTPVTWPTFELTWEELPVSEIQNARSEMLVVRNQNLVDNVETNPLFIFSTNRVVAPGVVTPLIEYGRRIEINSFGANLADALNNCFNIILQGDAVGQIVTIEMSYGFELVKGDDSDSDGLVTYLPIGLYPSQVLTATTGQYLAKIIDEWYLINQPTEDGGEWVFSLRLYSKQTSQPLTLLYVKRLYYLLNG